MTGDEVRSFFFGAVVGLFGVGVVAGLGSVAYIQSVETKVRRGWNLTPVLVAKADLKVGDTLGVHDLVERSVPEQLLTSSVVRPDAMQNVVGQKLSAPLSAGEPLRWSYVGGANTKAGLMVELAACAQADPGYAAPEPLDGTAVRARYLYRGAR